MMDYDSMPAGREMDALVAEKVMGIPKEMWHSECRFHKTDDLEIGIYEGKVDDSGWCYSCAESVGLGVKTPDRYSTSISAACEVVDKISSVGILPPHCYGFALEINKDDNIWTAGFRESDYDKGDVWVNESMAETAPLAICRAALKAVGKEGG